MKKKLMSLLLAVCLLAALAPAAFAADTQNKDYVAYYLTEYEVKSGDTMTSICNTRGITLSSYQTVIKNVNNLSNFNYLIAGQKYWVPATARGAATAYYTVYKHVLVSGDTVYNLCSTYGIEMEKYSDILMDVNNVSSLTSFMVGQSIYIPVYTTSTGVSVPVTSAPGTTAAPGATTAPTAAPGATTAPTATPATGAQNNDYVAFYLTKYEMKSGDTITSVCTTRGVKFADYEKIIKSVNKITNFNYLIAGRSYWLPSTTVGAATEYYAVYKHILVSGDTVYNLCLQYKIDFQKYSDLIMKINNVTSLTKFMVGKTILLPVYKAGATGGTTGTTGTTGTATDITAAGTGSSTTTVTTNPDGSTTTINTTTTDGEKPNLFDPTTAAKYYLIPYTVASGDNLVKICNALGTSFSKSATIISGVNNLASFANIAAGTSLWLPVSSYSGTATSYYTVTNHKMAAGETVYGICKAANADFAATYKLLTQLNSGVNFNWIKVGDVIAIPVLTGK